MRTVILGGLAAIGLAASAAGATGGRVEAQPFTFTAPNYAPAPWWMREPIIAATGEVQTHIPANRASFSAQFNAVDRSLAVAQKSVSDRVKALARTLQAYGSEKAQVETSLSIVPIYEQYRDKQGELQTNARADKIERYEANVRFSVQVRDLSVLERAYAAVISAHPASMQQVSFSLEPENETNTELFKAAVADAARRARLAVEATGAHLGKVRLIDPTSRACETDVLVAGADRNLADYGGPPQEIMVTGQRVASPRMMAAPAPPPPPPAPGEEVAPGDLLPLQAPLQTLQRKACVIYSID